MNTKRVEKLIHELLKEIGENPGREGLKKTPLRVAKSFEFLTQGYGMNHKALINDALFSTKTENMIIVRDIEVYSLCEHHLLPFFGRAHIGYIPTKKVLGVSKLARIVDLYARRLQLQERLTAEIAEEIKQITHAQGVGVVMECQHLCMMMRGVSKQNSVMVTSSVLGCFHDEDSCRTEFLTLIGKSL